MSPPAFQRKILAWFDRHGRKTLPWQLNKTPYRVWVSEVMLQQTQVNTVIPYFERFMQRFPNIAALAKASEDEVLHLWTGLGYYSRARNLHRSAQKIIEEFRGVFPATFSELEQLPGVGRSTAGAILAIAFEKQATILDGNVKRVLTRFLGITEWSGEKSVLEILWKTSERLTPKKRIADYTQAIMDLGATVCVRGKPLCESCPLEKNCLAREMGIEKNLPRARPKKILPVKQSTLLVLQHQQKIFLQKRASTGIWGGLWSLPELPGFPTKNEINTWCRQEWGQTVKVLRTGTPFRHTFTHFHLDILPVFIEVHPKSPKIMKTGKTLWYDPEGSHTIGLPAPIKKILTGHLNHDTTDSLPKT